MQAGQIEFLELLNGQVQYVVPRWQRRYRWGQFEIERLIDDLLTVATAGPEAGHYGGTLLTFPEPGPAGVVKTIRVVDGQQRLTTVSILLACIAEKLGPNGSSGIWTAQLIRNDRLTNPGKAPEKIRKLRLQDKDEEEYRELLAGETKGAGAVAQAWRTIRRLVARNDVGALISGLERLRVVSIGLDANEDPQQIFESINATGRPLTESEKVKNWLLMGLPDNLQQELHEGSWHETERALGAEYSTDPVDEFLRDVLRWRTGQVYGIDRVYEGLRRWAVRHGHASDRPRLCRELARLSRHYGIVTGTAGVHQDQRVERQLRHLRAMGIDVHRPLSLRLLDDADEYGGARATNEEVAQVLGWIGAWVTRLWLANRPTAGLNKAVAELAHGPGPSDSEQFADYWLGRISGLRNNRLGVPDDEAVKEGIRTRRAYGGSATSTAFAVLCAMMEAEHREEAPARDRLTMEHIMPQKLTSEWKHALGEGSEEIHGRYRDCLANLTLSGDATNAGLGTKTFNTKKQVYENSPVGMTRRLANESVWNEETLKQRAGYLTTQALSLWPWQAPRQTTPESAALKWRIDGGDWHIEDTASGMVLNVAGTLVARDPINVQRLSGKTLTRDLQPASRIPAGSKVGSLTFRAVPGFDHLVLYPYERDYPTAADRCRKMGELCAANVEVELGRANRTMEFWQFLKDHTGGVPGQQDNWRGSSQWTSQMNTDGDRIGIYVGNPDTLWLYIRAHSSGDTQKNSDRMKHFSRRIQQDMADQQLGDNLEKNSDDGRSINIEKRWVRDDEDEWAGAASWIKEQQERLEIILTSL